MNSLIVTRFLRNSMNSLIVTRFLRNSMNSIKRIYICLSERAQFPRSSRESAFERSFRDRVASPLSSAVTAIESRVRFRAQFPRSSRESAYDRSNCDLRSKVAVTRLKIAGTATFNRSVTRDIAVSALSIARCVLWKSAICDRDRSLETQYIKRGCAPIAVNCDRSAVWVLPGRQKTNWQNETASSMAYFRKQKISSVLLSFRNFFQTQLK